MQFDQIMIYSIWLILNKFIPGLSLHVRITSLHVDPSIRELLTYLKKELAFYNNNPQMWAQCQALIVVSNNVFSILNY